MKFLAHTTLLLFVALMFLPLYLAVVAASHEGNALMHSPIPVLPGPFFFKNMKTVLVEGITATDGMPVVSMLFNSFLMAAGIAIGKIILALSSAFALVYFNF